MVGLLEDVKQRTQLAGYNRLELLLFRLGMDQRFAINVFKVREVIMCPALSWVPHTNPSIRGIANIRGNTILMIDLGMALGRQPMESPEKGFVIVSEFNCMVQGFLVSAVDRIINVKWEDMATPPKGLEGNHYLTAITLLDDEMIEILDVEKILEEVTEVTSLGLSEVSERKESITSGVRHVLVVDDSSVARNQITRTLEQIGVECTTAVNGREALELLKKWADEGPLSTRIAMVISDIEMPEMDGYTLTTEIRNNQLLEDLYVVLHSSLSGVFNQAMVEKVGADKFVAKFSAENLANVVVTHIQSSSAVSSV